MPDTGVGVERERALSSIFIRTADYGTRSSTALTIDTEGEVRFAERTFVDGRVDDERHFEFRLHEPPEHERVADG